ncbi:hypothetical protein ACHAXA_010266 [Cyclostephanos tholiformis]|uniref:Uncharacterized protein n=1 Tax=Cyclostephanos tholiformis TaxID=382380 RepID=A0ABD3RUD7_9STRA
MLNPQLVGAKRRHEEGFELQMPDVELCEAFGCGHDPDGRVRPGRMNLLMMCEVAFFPPRWRDVSYRRGHCSLHAALTDARREDPSVPKCVAARAEGR